MDQGQHEIDAGGWRHKEHVAPFGFACYFQLGVRSTGSSPGRARPPEHGVARRFGRGLEPIAGQPAL
jgi:hypothetical protein